MQPPAALLILGRLAMVDDHGCRPGRLSETDQTPDCCSMCSLSCVLKQEAGLRLDTGLLIKQGSSSGQVVAPGNSAASALIQRVTSTSPDERMPPEGEPLTAQQIAELTLWINSGALSPEDEEPELDPRNHWAFKSIERPSVPTHSLSWGTDPIDAFVAARLQQHELTPQSEAPRIELVRRLYLDVIGMPPTLDEFGPTQGGYRQWLVRAPGQPLTRLTHAMVSVGRDIGWTSGDIATGGGWAINCAIAKCISGTGATGSSNRSTTTWRTMK